MKSTVMELGSDEKVRHGKAGGLKVPELQKLQKLLNKWGFSRKVSPSDMYGLGLVYFVYVN